MLGIVVANMVRAIRSVSVERGHDPRAFALLPFGGAGPLHATDVAKSLGIRRCLVPFAPGILCAQGLIVSDLRETFVRTAVTPLSDARMADVTRAHRRAARRRRATGSTPKTSSSRTATIDIVLDARYVGQNFELAIGLGSADPLPGADDDQAALLRRARARLRLPQSGRPDRDREFPPDRGRQAAPAGGAARRAAQERQGAKPHRAARSGSRPTPRRTRRSMIARRCMPGDTIAGPAVIEQLDSTTCCFPATAPRSIPISI